MFISKKYYFKINFIIKISIFKNNISHLKEIKLYKLYYILNVKYYLKKYFYCKLILEIKNFISGYKNNFMILLNKINELIIYFS